MSVAGSRRVCCWARLLLLLGGAYGPGVAGCAPQPGAAGALPATIGEPNQPVRYEVVVTDRSGELAVEAILPAGIPSEVSVDTGAEPFVRHVELLQGEAFHAIEPRNDSWFLPACPPLGCRIRYRYSLRDAAHSLGDINVAADLQSVLLAPPSTWLLYPIPVQDGRRFRFRVTTPTDMAFATGVNPAPDGEPNTYEADLSDLPSAPYSAFGPLRTHRMQAGGGIIETAILPGELDLPDEAILRWIGRAERAVSSYFGRYPVRRVLVLIVPSAGRGIGFSRTLGNGGASIVAPVGRVTDEQVLAADWVMTHEMIHLGFPNLSSRHSWLEEGMATYVEPLARARAGQLAVEEVWKGLLEGIPHGLPEPGDQGLDNTATWGRTYWGGALFCLLADIAIRERTHNDRSLDDALRGILTAGGNVTVRWKLDRLLSEGDRATGVGVLKELHAKMGAAPYAVDVDDLFQRLGVKWGRGKVELDDTAPLAPIRKAMTEPSPVPP